MQPIHADRLVGTPLRKSKKRNRVLCTAMSYLRQLCMVGSFFAINLIFIIPCLLYTRLVKDHHIHGRKLINKLLRFWLGMAERLNAIYICFPQIKKFQALRSTIIVCNHPSLIDALLLLSVIPNTACIMRSNLTNNFFIGPITRMAGFVPNDSGLAMVREGGKILEQGGNILIFPEGTRTTMDPINPFKQGFALIAKKYHAPVQTVFIGKTGNYLSKHTALLQPASLPIVFHFYLGEVFEIQDKESAQDLVGRVETYFNKFLADGNMIFDVTYEQS